MLIKNCLHSLPFISVRVINKKEEHALKFSITDAMKDMKLSRSESVDSDTEDPSPDLPQIRGELQEYRIVSELMPSGHRVK